ncbi:MAG: Hsp20/alpha crystallin family protein [Spirochaetia bacterium]|jgi:HSP20 family protein|nr:Hsp20/alpha crystallin family protein [Spirochaetia bacterium]
MNSLVTYRPLRSGLRPVWGNLFDDFFDYNLDDHFRKPLTDIVEKDGSFDFKIELPGFKEEEIEVKLEKDILSIKAEKTARDEEKAEDVNRHIITERREKYYRSFILPENADEEKIEAKFENGLLSLEVSKKEKELPKKIEIKK